MSTPNTRSNSPQKCARSTARELDLGQRAQGASSPKTGGAPTAPPAGEPTAPPMGFTSLGYRLVVPAGSGRTVRNCSQVTFEYATEVGCGRGEHEGYLGRECVGFNGIELQQPHGISRQEYRHRQIASCVS